MPAVLEPETEVQNTFQHVHLDQIDPSFTPIDDGFYNLKIVSTEVRKYDNTDKGGKAGEYINLGFAITDDPKFSGRRVYDSIFPNSFGLRALRRLQDACGISQEGSVAEWLAQLGTIAPIVKMKVIQVPDVYRDGSPNPKNMTAEGTAGVKNVLDWKSGVQPEG